MQIDGSTYLCLALSRYITPSQNLYVYFLTSPLVMAMKCSPYPQLAASQYLTYRKLDISAKTEPISPNQTFVSENYPALLPNSLYSSFMFSH